MPKLFTNVQEIETAFYRAFETLDNDLMDRVWADGMESSCVHPGGDLLEGKSAVMQSWMEIFSGAQRPTLTFRIIRTTEIGDMAVHLTEELIRPSGSKTEPSRVLSTNIYRYGEDGWRMVAHHASLPLRDNQPQPKDSAKLH